MKNKTILSLLLGTALSLASAGFAAAQDKTVKIGVLGDQSGLYADLGGPGSILAAQMAVEDSGLAAKGWKIDVISGDHQNKPDVGSAITRQWFDVDKVDVVVDVPNSGVALAVSQIANTKNKLFVVSGAAASTLTGAKRNAVIRHSAGNRRRCLDGVEPVHADLALTHAPFAGKVARVPDICRTVEKKIGVQR